MNAQTQAWDVFLSFKKNDEHGNPTRDKDLARTVHDYLTNKGLRVFFSDLTLESNGVADYKRAIDEALEQASSLVAIGTSRAHLESPWVRYEWDGFISDILMAVKPDGRVFGYVDGLRPGDLPWALRRVQVFLHGSDSMERLYRFVTRRVERPIGASIPPTVPEIPREDDQDASRTRQEEDIEAGFKTLNQFLPDFEWYHLQQLSKPDPHPYRHAETLEKEMRNLERMELVRFKNEATNWNRLPTDREFLLREHVDLTDLGKRFVAWRRQIPQFSRVW